MPATANGGYRLWLIAQVMPGLPRELEDQFELAAICDLSERS